MREARNMGRGIAKSPGTRQSMRASVDFERSGERSAASGGFPGKRRLRSSGPLWPDCARFAMGLPADRPRGLAQLLFSHSSSASTRCRSRMPSSSYTASKLVLQIGFTRARARRFDCRNPARMVEIILGLRPGNSEALYSSSARLHCANQKSPFPGGKGREGTAAAVRQGTDVTRRCSAALRRSRCRS